MRKKKNNLKQRWMNDISNFQIGWDRDWRKGLLHPYDVKNINEKFKHLKLKIKHEHCTRENRKVYFHCLSHLFKLVSEADERMTKMCSILTDLMSIK
jgi:hypothetical protein